MNNVKELSMDVSAKNPVEEGTVNSVSAVCVNESKVYQLFKRGTDIGCSFVGLILSIPILIVFVILIKLESKGPAIFVQERVGLQGKVFNIYKLRSMVVDAEKNGAQWATKNDARITKVGKFIRKTRVDEIPQLFNILKGDMSLIGPRPERHIFTEQFEQEIPGFKQRLLIKPGVTGWAQVNGGYDITPKEKLALDMEYIEKQNVKLDIMIILYTIKIVFTGSGAR